MLVLVETAKFVNAFQDITMMELIIKHAPNAIILGLYFKLLIIC